MHSFKPALPALQAVLLDTGRPFMCMVRVSVFVCRTVRTAEPIQMWWFGGVGGRLAWSKNHVLDEVHVGATWRIRLNDPCPAAMPAVTTIIVATCQFVEPVHSSFRIILLNSEM